MGVQIDLALCCKATLPILCMGHVRVTINEQKCKRALLQLTRCLTKHPSGVRHLELRSPKGGDKCSIHGLIKLRCVHACLPGAGACTGMSLLRRCPHSSPRMGLVEDVGPC